ncbi:hypothetical protein IMZ48_28640 [Candidatus Bathyarchaeota archaeon]|nr:hypothetical protein [Candidatus Bathyarchaeota archaeon]
MRRLTSASTMTYAHQRSSWTRPEPRGLGGNTQPSFQARHIGKERQAEGYRRSTWLLSGTGRPGWGRPTELGWKRLKFPDPC